MEQALAKLTQRYDFKFAQIAGGYFIIFFDKNLEGIEKFEKEILGEFKKLQVSYMGQNIKPRIDITTVQINPKQVKNLKLIYKLIFYAEKVRDTRDIYHFLELSQKEVVEFLQQKEDATQKLYYFLEKDLITFHLQPIVELQTGKVSHFEVLMRFLENGKVVSAGKYIDLIYELGLIVDFDLKLLEKLRHHLKDFKKLGKALYVNVSSEDLKLALYRNRLKELIEDFQKEEVPIFIELTEQVVFKEWDFIESMAKDYHLKLVIDDFGTGYSSLKLVAELVAKGISKTVKVDMSLTKDYLKNPYTKALVDSIAHFGKSVGIDLVAEGIENEELYKVFKGLGIPYGQGWYFYKPMPLEEALKRFAS